jgi:hypothetical protein
MGLQPIAASSTIWKKGNRTMPNDQFYTPKGLRLEAAYENARNDSASDCFEAILKEAYGVQKAICAHHIVYVLTERRDDGFDYTLTQEIASADSLIFNHDIAKRIWGEDEYKSVLTKLACEPVETRDALLSSLYNNRDKMPSRDGIGAG